MSRPPTLTQTAGPPPLSQKIALPVEPIISDHTASLPDQDPQSEVTAPAPQQEHGILLSTEHDRALPDGIVLASKEGDTSLVPEGHTLSPEPDSSTTSSQAMALSKPVQSTNGQRQGKATHGRISQTSAHTWRSLRCTVRHRFQGHQPSLRVKSYPTRFVSISHRQFSAGNVTR